MRFGRLTFHASLDNDGGPCTGSFGDFACLHLFEPDSEGNLTPVECMMRLTRKLTLWFMVDWERTRKTAPSGDSRG